MPLSVRACLRLALGLTVSWLAGSVPTQAVEITVTFGETVGAANAFAGGAAATHLYSDAIKPQTALYSDPPTLALGFFDAVEPAFQAGGPPPVPDGSVVFRDAGGVPLLPELDFVLGFEEGAFTLTGLDPLSAYQVTAIVGDLSDFGYYAELMGSLVPVPETIVVTGNGAQLGLVSAVVGAGVDQWITRTLDLVAHSDAGGALTIGFNQVFFWNPLVPVAPPIGFQNGIRVEQISLSPAIPEPGTLVLFGLGLGVALLVRRWRDRAA